MVARQGQQLNGVETTLLKAFSYWVDTTPDATALSFRGQRWSYAQLDAQANRLARWMGSRIPPVGERDSERLIPVCMKQGPHRIAALLAILKLGSAYVPIEADYPAARIRYMLADIEASFVVTESELAQDILQARDIHDRPLELLTVDDNKVAIAREDSSPLEPDVSPDSLCYIIYTSGSTGNPKGVAIPHRGVTRLVLNTNYIQIKPGDCIAQASNVAFDASTFEIWGALLNGARIALVDKDTLLNARHLAHLLREEQINVMFMTTGLFNQHVATDPTLFAPLDVLLFGGEAVAIDIVHRLMTTPERPRHLIHCYGPTENTTFSTFFEIQEMPEPGIPIPIGKAIAHSTCRVVDPHMRPIAVGDTGELLVGGLGLAREYWRNPDNTAAKFITGVVDAGDERYYRTGDVVRVLPSGDLVFVGRVDNQVKIRGFRIEIEEIELALEAHPQLARAIVLVDEDVSHTKRLRAYLLPQPDNSLPSVADLRAFAEQRLPTFMVPSVFVRVDHLPLNANGKVDRRALAALAGEVLWSEQEVVEPRTELEQRLRQCWSTHLQIAEEQISVTHNFFELGGHSLIAALILVELNETLSLDLQVKDFFAEPTIASLAVTITNHARSSAIAIPPTDQDEDLPLSWSQEQIWLHQQLAPHGPIYNEPLKITLPEAIELAPFTAAVNRLLERHEALRARVEVKQGLPTQRIEPFVPFELPIYDLRHLPQPRALAKAEALATAQASRVFEMNTEPLIRFLLIRLEDQLWHLYVTGHHLVLDGVGMFQVFLPELETVYRQLLAGGPGVLPPLQFRFRDWLVWQRQPLARNRWTAQEDYWKTKLADLQPLNLPGDYTGGDKETADGARICIAISQRTTHRLQELAKREKTSLFVTLLAAFKVLLLRWTHQRDIAIGTVVAGRNLPGLQEHVGDFLNMLILRTTIPEQADFATVLQAVRATCLEAFAHQDIPFQFVSRYATNQPVASENGSPVRVAFVLEPEAAASRSGWHLSQMENYPGASKFDLSFELEKLPDRIIGKVEYRTGIFESSTIERLIHHFEVLLEALLDTPDRPVAELDLLDASDRQAQLIEWLDNEVDYGDPSCLHHLIEEQVDLTPEATAVVFEEQRLSYRQFDQQANRLAHLLHAYGVGPETPVAVWTDRNELHLILLYAVLKAGGAYVPIGSDDPADRVQFILEDTAASVVLCDAAHRERLQGVSASVLVFEELQNSLTELPASRPERRAAPDNLAYIIYTSGSTGRPKGVMIEHHQIVERLHWVRAELRSKVGDVYLHMLSLAFDASLIPTWWPLCQGGAVLIPSAADLQDPHALKQLVLRHRVTHLVATPAMLRVLVDVLDKQQGLAVHYVMAGGERLSTDLLERLRRLAARVVNAYGPTEATILATSWEAHTLPGERPPIGIGVANTRLYVLDEARQLVPLGVPGELYIGGRCVARGYLNRPEQNAAAFLEDPFVPGARVYRTGDRVRYLSTGDLDYLGRNDTQVKIRGFRVELSEIEETLRRHSGIRDCAVIVHEKSPAQKQLVAYLVAEAEPLSLEDVRRHLREHLPGYMVPAALVPLDALPLTANGKLNVRVLPEPSAEGADSLESQLTPRNELERQLHDLWSSILGVKTIGVSQDFYDLGGDSLQALQLVAQAEEQGLPLRLRDLFEHRTIAAQALYLAQSRHASQFAQEAPRYLATSSPPLEGSCPLLPIQHWFFERNLPEPHHWNQAFILHPQQRLVPEHLAEALKKLAEHHDALRLRFQAGSGGIEQRYWQASLPECAPKLEVLDLSVLPEQKRASALRAECERLQGSLNYSEGPVAVAALFNLDPDSPQRLWLGFHHLVIDGVSWRILLEDLARLYSQLEHGDSVSFPGKSWSVRQWAQTLQSYVENEALQELPFWTSQLSDAPPMTWPLAAAGREAEKRVHSFQLDSRLTTDLVTRAPFWFGVDINTVLLSALVAALGNELSAPEIIIWLEGHGREAITDEANLSRTLGWFTSIFPLRLPTGRERDLRSLLADVQARIARVPNHGLGFLALRYLSRQQEVRAALELPDPLPISFNYLGRFAGKAESELFQLGSDAAGDLHGAGNPRTATLELNCLVLGGRFRMDWSFAAGDAANDWVEKLADRYCQALTELVKQGRAWASETALTDRSATDCLLPLRSKGSRRPLFLVHPAGGNSLSYQELVAQLHPDQPVYGLDCTDGYAGESFRGMAAAYVQAIRSVQVKGPYLLGGWSLGGILAHEMATQLEAQGEEVATVFQLDSRPITHPRQADYMKHMCSNRALLLSLLVRHLEHIAGQSISIDYAELTRHPDEEVEDWFMAELLQRSIFSEALIRHFVQRFVDDFRSCSQLATEYRNPGRCRAPVVLFRASEISQPHPGFLPLEEPLVEGQDPSYGWYELTHSPVAVHLLPGNHETFVFAPHVHHLALALNRELDRLQSRGPQDVFSAFSENQWQTLLKQLEAVYTVPGQVLVKQGEISRDLYILAEGQVEVTLDRPGQPDKRLALIGTSTVIGENGFIDGQPRTATVTALTEGLAYRLTEDGYRFLQQEHPDLATVLLMQIAQVLASRYRLLASATA